MTLLERLGGREAITRGIVHTFRILSRRPCPPGTRRPPGRSWTHTCGGWASPRPGQGGQPDGRRAPRAGPGTRPRLILQGHLDMVCAVRPGGSWNPSPTR